MEILKAEFQENLCKAIHMYLMALTLLKLMYLKTHVWDLFEPWKFKVCY
jgi:hypothetical protein